MNVTMVAALTLRKSFPLVPKCRRQTFDTTDRRITAMDLRNLEPLVISELKPAMTGR